MSTSRPRLFFDFVDPLSYLLARELAADGDADSAPEAVAWTPFELRPPPSRLLAIRDVWLDDRWVRARAQAEEEGIELRPPELVPWTRKAHELTVHAETKGVAATVRTRTFEAYFIEGADIGRVDVLVDIGRTAGLDLTETKAVLDVDRFESAILEARALGTSLAVADVPTLIRDDRRLEGFHNRSTLGTFLRA